MKKLIFMSAMLLSISGFTQTSNSIQVSELKTENTVLHLLAAQSSVTSIPYWETRQEVKADIKSACKKFGGKLIGESVFKGATYNKYDSVIFATQICKFKNAPVGEGYELKANEVAYLVSNESTLAGITHKEVQQEIRSEIEDACKEINGRLVLSPIFGGSSYKGQYNEVTVAQMCIVKESSK